MAAPQQAGQQCLALPDRAAAQEALAIGVVADQHGIAQKPRQLLITLDRFSGIGRRARGDGIRFGFGQIKVVCIIDDHARVPTPKSHQR